MDDNVQIKVTYENPDQKVIITVKPIDNENADKTIEFEPERKSSELDKVADKYGIMHSIIMPLLSNGTVK